MPAMVRRVARLWTSVVGAFTRHERDVWTLITLIWGAWHLTKAVLHAMGRAHENPIDQALWTGANSMAAALALTGAFLAAPYMCAAAMSISSSVWMVWGVTLLWRSQTRIPPGPLDNGVGPLFAALVAAFAAVAWITIGGPDDRGDYSPAAGHGHGGVDRRDRRAHDGRVLPQEDPAS